jgi:transposase
MDKFEIAGVEVSAKVLVVALKSNGQMRSSEFDNTAAGHKQLIHFLRRYSQTVRVCVESTGLYGLDLALALDTEKGLGSWWPTRVRCGTSARR